MLLIVETVPLGSSDSSTDWWKVSWHSTMFERSSMPSLLFDDDQVILLRLTLPRSTPPRPPTNRRETSRRAALCRTSARLKKKNRAMPVDYLVESLLCR
jgi:hypothetical protein